MAVGRYWRASVSAGRAAVGDDPLEALVARQAEQHPRVMRVVVHHQQHVIAFDDVVAVVDDHLFGLGHGQHRQRRDALGRVPVDTGPRPRRPAPSSPGRARTAAGTAARAGPV